MSNFSISFENDANSSVASTTLLDLVKVANNILRKSSQGVLATIDENGNPHMRWMSALATQDFPILYTVTGPNTRKLGHIRAHPNVEWMFSDEELKSVINLKGSARVILDPEVVASVWQRIEDKIHACFLESCRDGGGFAVIETLFDAHLTFLGTQQCAQPHFCPDVGVISP